MSISSINSSGYPMMRGMHPPDPSKMAEDLFAKLDTKGQGFIEKSDLEHAFGKISQADSSNNASAAAALFSRMDNDGNGKVTKEDMSATIRQIAAELDGPFPRMRLQGDSPALAGSSDDPGLSEDRLGAALLEIDSDGSKSVQEGGDMPGNSEKIGSNSVAKEVKAYQAPKNPLDIALAPSTDAQFMKQMLQLLQAYGSLDLTEQSNKFSVSV